MVDWKQLVQADIERGEAARKESESREAEQARQAKVAAYGRALEEHRWNTRVAEELGLKARLSELRDQLWAGAEVTPIEEGVGDNAQRVFTGFSLEAPYERLVDVEYERSTARAYGLPCNWKPRLVHSVGINSSSYWDDRGKYPAVVTCKMALRVWLSEQRWLNVESVGYAPSRPSIDEDGEAQLGMSLDEDYMRRCVGEEGRRSAHVRFNLWEIEQPARLHLCIDRGREQLLSTLLADTRRRKEREGFPQDFRVRLMGELKERKKQRLKAVSLTVLGDGSWEMREYETRRLIATSGRPFLRRLLGMATGL